MSDAERSPMLWTTALYPGKSCGVWVEGRGVVGVRSTMLQTPSSQTMVGCGVCARRRGAREARRRAQRARRSMGLLCGGGVGFDLFLGAFEEGHHDAMGGIHGVDFLGESIGLGFELGADLLLIFAFFLEGFQFGLEDFKFGIDDGLCLGAFFGGLLVLGPFFAGESCSEAAALGEGEVGGDIVGEGFGGIGVAIAKEHHAILFVDGEQEARGEPGDAISLLELVVARAVGFGDFRFVAREVDVGEDDLVFGPCLPSLFDEDAVM